MINFEKNLSNALQSNLPVIWIDTIEENRLEVTINNIINSDKKLKSSELYRWTHTKGLKEVDPVFDSKDMLEFSSFQSLFKKINKDIESNRLNNPKIYILHLQKEILTDFRFQRYIRDIKEYGNNNIKFIFVSNGLSVPSYIKNLVYYVDFERLNEVEVNFFLSAFINKKINDLTSEKERIQRNITMEDNPFSDPDNNKDQYNEELNSINKKIEAIKSITDEEKELMTKSALGLTSNEIINVLNLSMVNKGTLDSDFIAKCKIDRIKRNDVLDYIVPNVTFDDIGGNHVFKEWINEVKYTMSPKASEYGLEPARGHLALGVPGTSKTFSAEALAGELNIPLLKLSSDKIFNSLVGESEKKIKEAFDVAKACAPCILLIDEVEKTLSGVGSSNMSDAGTTSRIFATILENLNDPQGVYTIMTSNDIMQLPPELTRIGRIDSLWYFSVPDKEERIEIINIHLNKRKINLSDEKIKLIVDNTENFTGAEIEQVIKNIQRKSFVRMMSENKEEMTFTDQDIIDSSEEVSPIFEVNKERILLTERMMEGRVRRASLTNDEKKSRIKKNISNFML